MTLPASPEERKIPASYEQRKVIAAKLQVMQRADPANLHLAHDIGLFHYWGAKALTQQGRLREAEEAWLAVISNWAMVIGDDRFLSIWCRGRARVYQTSITPDEVEGLRLQLREKLQSDLTEFMDHCERAGHPLAHEQFYLLLDLEIAAYQSLKRLGGFPIPAARDGTNKLSCGPLMLRRLQLTSAFSDFTKPPEEGASNTLDDWLDLLKNRASGSLEQETRSRLMGKVLLYFSQLGIAAVCLDRERPELALALIESLIPQLGKPLEAQRAPQSAQPEPLALAIDERSPQFKEKNPSYAQDPHPGKTFLAHATQVAITAHMEVAKLSITLDPMKLSKALASWQNALALAKETHQEEQTHADIQEIILRRATTLDNTGRAADALALLNATIAMYPQGSLAKKLAELLTDAGVKAGNDERWEEAVQHLRRAYALDPLTERVWINFVSVLQLAAEQAYIHAQHTMADHAYSSGQLAQVKTLLQEALQVLEVALSRDPKHERALKQQSQVRIRLEIAGVG